MTKRGVRFLVSCDTIRQVREVAEMPGIGCLVGSPGLGNGP